MATMAKADGAYFSIIVESYRSSKAGPHGYLHIRPVKGQHFPTTLHVECSKKLIDNYPVGTKFRIKVKLTDRLGEGEFLYSYYGWPFEIVK
jgi:hypothetical protein